MIGGQQSVISRTVSMGESRWTSSSTKSKNSRNETGHLCSMLTVINCSNWFCCSPANSRAPPPWSCRTSHSQSPLTFLFKLIRMFEMGKFPRYWDSSIVTLILNLLLESSPLSEIFSMYYQISCFNRIFVLKGNCSPFQHVILSEIEVLYSFGCKKP